MLNFRGNIESRTMTAPIGGVTGGVPVIIGNLFGIPSASASAGDAFALSIFGVFTLPKATGIATTAGASAYYDDADGNVTTDSTKRPIGHFDAVAASDATEVDVIVFPCSTTDAELTSKADKVTSPTANNFASLTSTGNLADSGKKPSDYASADHVHAASVITITPPPNYSETDVGALITTLAAQVYALQHP